MSCQAEALHLILRERLRHSHCIDIDKHEKKKKEKILLIFDGF